jgi:hypothetical protein
MFEPTVLALLDLSKVTSILYPGRHAAATIRRMGASVLMASVRGHY